MTLPTAPELVDAPTWTIRPEQPIDLDQIHELHREAFGRADEAELVDAIRSGATFVPDLSLVAAAADGSVLGHVLASIVWLDTEEGSPSLVRQDVLALAPLAVLPAHAGRGIGSALVREALAIADGREEACVLVLGAPSFYGRFGFVPARDNGIEGPYDAAGDAFQVRPRPETEPTPGTVVYPPMFEGL